MGLYGLVNRWSLEELHGQLFECCGDQWHPDPTGEGWPCDGKAWGGVDPVLDALGTAQVNWRMLRGGSLPGVNYIGGSRQLRRRVPPSLPLPWQGDATPKTEPPAGLVVADTSARTCSGAREPADPTVRRQRGAHTGTWRQC